MLYLMRKEDNMKNLVISILSSVIITGMDFWIYDDFSDRLIIAIVMAMVLFCAMASAEDWLRDCRMKRFWSNRFWRKIDEQKNRP